MTRFVRPYATGLAFLLVLMFAAPAAQAFQDKGEEFARVSVDSARILNLADANGIAVASPVRGSILTIHDRNQSGWLLVEIPGGYPVWVLGRYLEKTDVKGVYAVTRNAVNIRPGPSSDVTNFPLPQRLHAGDRVQVTKALDDTRPLTETWARIWSPPGVRAWIRASSVAVLSAGEDGVGMWNMALQENVDRIAPSLGTPPAQSPKPVVVEEGVQALQAARARLQAEHEKSAPDYRLVRSEIEAVLARGPSGAVALEASNSLRLVEAYEEGLRIAHKLEEERLRRSESAREQQEQLWDSVKKKDPLGRVFLSRGLLFRRVDRDGVEHFRLRFGGKTVAELHCPSGRYNLRQFAGYEVGVQGSAYQTTEAREYPALEISRVELIRRP